MAIRPTDIQASIFNATQTQGITQRAEEAPRAAQAAAQASFAAHVQNREESVEETGKGEGNRVNADAEGGHPAWDQEKRERKARGLIEESVDDAAGFDEPPHLIDFTA